MLSSRVLTTVVVPETRILKSKNVPRASPANMSVLPRKVAKQSRSTDTVDVILEGAARVLTEHGYEKFMTNSVAERVGVSVGSLYQYFPNKNALVGALLLKFHGAQSLTWGAALKSCRGMPLSEAAALLAGVVVDLHARDPRLSRVLAHELPRVGELCDILVFLGTNITTPMQEFLALYPEDLSGVDLEFSAFVITHTIQSLLDRLDGAGLSERRDDTVRALSGLMMGVLSVRVPPDSAP